MSLVCLFNIDLANSLGTKLSSCIASIIFLFDSFPTYPFFVNISRYSRNTHACFFSYINNTSHIHASLSFYDDLIKSMTSFFVGIADIAPNFVVVSAATAFENVRMS